MTYRKIEPREWARLMPIFEMNGWTMPNRDLATAIIAEDADERICGVLILEFKLHAEPLWIRPDSIGQVSFRGLASVMAQQVKGISEQLPEGAAVYFMTSMDNVEKLAEPLGFQPMEERAWRLAVK